MYTSFEFDKALALCDQPQIGLSPSKIKMSGEIPFSLLSLAHTRTLSRTFHTFSLLTRLIYTH